MAETGQERWLRFPRLMAAASSTAEVASGAGMDRADKIGRLRWVVPPVATPFHQPGRWFRIVTEIDPLGPLETLHFRQWVRMFGHRVTFEPPPASHSSSPRRSASAGRASIACWKRL